MKFCLCCVQLAFVQKILSIPSSTFLFYIYYTLVFYAVHPRCSILTIHLQVYYSWQRCSLQILVPQCPQQLWFIPVPLSIRPGTLDWTPLWRLMVNIVHQPKPSLEFSTSLSPLISSLRGWS